MNIPQYLGEHDIAFELLRHPRTFDAQHLAQSVHVSGHHVAKTVLLRVDGAEYAVAILPATHYVDEVKVCEVLHAKTVVRATETELSQHCPDCEVGALPPFGSQYGMRTILDSSLTTDTEILFEGNTHSDAIRMKTQDFVEIEQPIVAAIS